MHLKFPEIPAPSQLAMAHYFETVATLYGFAVAKLVEKMPLPLGVATLGATALVATAASREIAADLQELFTDFEETGQQGSNPVE